MISMSNVESALYQQLPIIAFIFIFIKQIQKFHSNAINLLDMTLVCLKVHGKALKVSFIIGKDLNILFLNKNFFTS